MNKKKVLFLCTGNSARSQIAEALLRQKAGSELEVFSAGTAPKGLNPLAVQVMKEIGINISDQQSKDVGQFANESFDWVITVCDTAKEQCPVFPGSRSQHWSIPDPEDLEEFRQIREVLSGRIDSFLKQAGVDFGDSK